MAKAVELARSKEWASAFRADPYRVALVGHSLGGFFGAMTTARVKNIVCFTFLAGADLGWMYLQARRDEGIRMGLETIFAQGMDAKGGPIRGDAQGVVSEIVSRAEAWTITSLAVDLATRPILLVAATRDEITPKTDHHDRLVAALRQVGAKQLTEAIFDDDHVFSAHRIGLATRLVEWLRAELLCNIGSKPN
ncbi:hypothetical protein JXO59_14670 [candidate division KSB1 bacterium]|nr:hypothetical protein [candidate division KSB1 bacterium]